MIKLLAFLLIFSPFLHAEDPIVVTLREDESLNIGCVPSTTDGSIPHPYEKGLENVFLSDIDLSGRLEIVSLENSDFQTSPDWVDYRNASHVVKMRLEEKKLVLKLFIDGRNEISLFSTPPLTGHLERDRRQVHALFDQFQKAVLGIPGIASTRILATVRSSNNKSELIEMDYDGNNFRKHFPSHPYIVTPTYVPPEKGMRTRGCFFVSYKTGQPKIYVGNLDSGANALFLPIRGNTFSPAVNPQGDRCAFICDVSGNPDLFIIPFSKKIGPVGKPIQILSASSGTQGSPAFSPNGKRVAFVSNQDGVPRIYVMDVPAPGTPMAMRQKTLISRLAREGTSPAWSPDGTKIAFSSGKRGERQIWVYDFLTGEENPVTSGPGSKENPSFAPDNFHLVYHMRDDTGSELYITDLLKRLPYQITVGTGEKRFASWEPLTMR